MKNFKKYVNFEDLNEEEKRTNKISYKRLIDRICDNMIMCNNILEVDEFLFDNVVVGDIYDEESETDVEIYQYFIIDVDEYTVEKLQELKTNDVIIAYSEKLENYILMVDHWGTSWDYVMTNIEPTEDLEEADL